jgi:hypothetical protein
MLLIRNFNIPAGIGATSDPINVSGKMFAVRDASSAFSVGFDGEAPVGPLERGDRVKRDYKTFQLVNLTIAVVAVQVAMGDDEIVDLRTSVRQQIASQTTLLYSGVIAPTTPATSMTMELANARRIEFIATAFTTNAGYMNVYSAQLPGNLITSIPAGQTFRMGYTGPIFVCSNNGTDGGFVSKTEF